MSGITIEQAIDAFGKGFSFTQSFTHPYEFVSLGPLWVMRDGPRQRGEYRTEEIIAHGVPPEEVVETIRSYGPSHCLVCAIQHPDEPLEEVREAYKACGFRAMHTEWLMARGLDALEEAPCAFPIHRVLTHNEADRVAKSARSKQILAEHLHDDDPPLRLYCAEEEGKPIGWVRSIRIRPDATSVSNMYVREPYRRKGIARSLMSRMLLDDRAAGASTSFLCASKAGAKLYQSLGYEQIGLLQVFVAKS